MIFTQQRNRLRPRFSECIPFVKCCMTVFSCFISWEINKSFRGSFGFPGFKGPWRRTNANRFYETLSEIMLYLETLNWISVIIMKHIISRQIELELPMELENEIRHKFLNEMVNSSAWLIFLHHSPTLTSPAPPRKFPHMIPKVESGGKIRRGHIEGPNKTFFALRNQSNSLQQAECPEHWFESGTHPKIVELLNKRCLKDTKDAIIWAIVIEVCRWGPISIGIMVPITVKWKTNPGFGKARLFKRIYWNNWVGELLPFGESSHHKICNHIKG